MTREKYTGDSNREQDDQTDWTRVRAMTDVQVEAAIAGDPEESGMIVDWSNATLLTQDRKKTMTIRLDSDVLDFYRGMGRGYQTTINAVLRSYMDHIKG